MTQENSKNELTANDEKSGTETNQSLGLYLQRQRQRKKQSIEEVSVATRITPETLHALESGNRGLLPLAVFTKGFVKIYAAHLGLNQADILERFSNEWGNVTNTPPEILSGESMAESSPFFLSSRFFFLLLLIVIVISLACFFFQADDTPSPAALTTIPNPQEQTSPPLVIKQKEVKQLKIIASTPPQQTLLVSPKSAGKIPLEGDDEQTQAPTIEPVVDDQMLKEKSSSSETSPPTTTPAKISVEPVTPEPKTLAQQDVSPTVIKNEETEHLPSLFQSLNLHIRFLKKTRISITQDDDHPEKYIFNSGEESTWVAASHITLHVDTADAVELTLNGSPVPIDNSHDGPLAITLPPDVFP
ncbi:MAG: helix-turn-helix domain-containing protein [Thermodesulfobacteriota bacterium]